MAALKQAYETCGSECDDEDWGDQDIAMVVRPEFSGLGSGHGFFAATASELDPEASSRDASDEDQTITEPAIKRRRDMEDDLIGLNHEDGAELDACGCGCDCPLSPSISPPQTCLSCNASLCSRCVHEGSRGGILCHCCRDKLVELRLEQSRVDASNMTSNMMFVIKSWLLDSVSYTMTKIGIWDSTMPMIICLNVASVI